MKKIVVSVFSLFVTTICSSQSFIELTDGTRISGNIEYKAPAFKKGYFVVNDTVRYDEVSVRSFQIGPNYFRKISPPGTAPSSFYLRTVKGKIDAFTKTSSQLFIGGGGTTNMTNRWDYYSIDNGPLKKVRYRFLKNDLRESTEAMKVMKQVTNLRVVSTILYTGGSALIVGGVASLANAEDNSLPPALIVGAIAFNANFFLLQTKRNKLLQAINAYNAEVATGL